MSALIELEGYIRLGYHLLHRVRKHTRLPLALGFGISTPIHAQTCDRTGADGVIAGSAIMEIVGHNLENLDVMERELQDYVKGMKQAAGSPKSNIKTEFQITPLFIQLPTKLSR